MRIKAGVPSFSQSSLALIASARQLVSFSVLEISKSIQCPYCGQRFELTVDTSIPSQQFTTDCEVCCRPFVVTAECEPGEILSLDVRAD